MFISVVQTCPVFGEIQNNVRNAIAMMEQVDVQLFVLPELFNTGYNFIDVHEVEQLSETTTGWTTQTLIEFARKKDCYIVYGFAEKAERLYNSAGLIGPQGLIGLYRKIHLYFREKLFFAPGDLGFPVFDLPICKLGIMICFDWIFPESVRTLALKGAQLIAHPANLVMPYCPDAMVTRCLENRVFTATADRVGIENRGGLSLSFIGQSEIVTPMGEILIRLDSENQDIAIAEVDLTLADNKQLNEFNNLFIDRKPKFYQV